MTESINPRWFDWAREIQALSQTGYHYAENEYQKERYRRLSEIAAEMMSEYSGSDLDQILNLYLTQSGYATPRVDVRGAVFMEDRILMVRERQDGGWTLPGGWADVGDVPSQAVEREVLEEAGFQVKAQRVIGVYDANRTGPLELFHAFKVVFLCELLGGDARPSIETTDVAFFDAHELPEVLSGERTKPKHLEDAFAVLRDPNLPTVFD
ncbi:MAG: NUDIX hydrolase [Anaerolineales bacterium]|nr:MAG: NUDIX hydrolase [Anaerolineales bacterium]